MKTIVQSNARAKLIMAALEANRGDEKSIEGWTGFLTCNLPNDYFKEKLPTIPDGTEITVDFGGDFGAYAIAFIAGSIHKIKLDLSDLNTIYWPKIDD